MKQCNRIVCFLAAFLPLTGCAQTAKTELPAPATTEIVQEENTTAPETPETPATTEDPETPAVSIPQPPAPTETPEPKKEQTDTLVCASANGLSVRAGKGTGYARIGTMDAGDSVMPLEVGGGWYTVAYRGSVGYVSAKYLTEKAFAVGSEKIEKVIGQGKLWLGTPYVYGAQRYHYGNGTLNSAFTTNEFDCSSLMQYIFKKGANVNLAMTSREQSLQGTAVSRSRVRRGDLMFFTNASRQNKSGIERIGHVALYLGNNYILHTASDYAVIEPISTTRESYFVCARRMIE